MPKIVVSQFRHDLVDEYRLMIHPLVLGAGKRLFRDETPLTRLRLVDSRSSGKGAMYTTAGEEE